VWTAAVALLFAVVVVVVLVAFLLLQQLRLHKIKRSQSALLVLLVLAQV
jgi:Ca2+/Na+ antiporter